MGKKKKRPKYLTPKKNRVVLTDKQMRDALDKVEKECDEIRRGFRFDREALSIRCGPGKK